MAKKCDHWTESTGIAKASVYAECPWCAIEQLRANAQQAVRILAAVEFDGQAREAIDAAIKLLEGRTAEPRAVDPNGPPRELLPLLREAVKALDAGVPIQPTSFVHEELIRLLPKASAVKSQHTTEDDFQHFLTYSKLSGQPPAELHHLRLAYYAATDVEPPDERCPHCWKDRGPSEWCQNSFHQPSETTEAQLRTKDYGPGATEKSSEVRPACDYAGPCDYQSAQAGKKDGQS